MLQGEAELSAAAVQQAQIQVASRMVRLDLDGAAQLLLRLLENAGLEQDQPEIGVQDCRVGILLQEDPRRLRRLQEIAALELEDRKQIEDVFVLGAQHLRLLDLLARRVQPPLAQALAGPNQVDEKDALIDRRSFTGGSGHHSPPISEGSAARGPAGRLGRQDQPVVLIPPHVDRAALRGAACSGGQADFAAER